MAPVLPTVLSLCSARWMDGAHRARITTFRFPSNAPVSREETPDA